MFLKYRGLLISEVKFYNGYFFLIMLTIKCQLGVATGWFGSILNFKETIRIAPRIKSNLNQNFRSVPSNIYIFFFNFLIKFNLFIYLFISYVLLSHATQHYYNCKEKKVKPKPENPTKPTFSKQISILPNRKANHIFLLYNIWLSKRFHTFFFISCRKLSLVN